MPLDEFSFMFKQICMVCFTQALNTDSYLDLRLNVMVIGVPRNGSGRAKEEGFGLWTSVDLGLAEKKLKRVRNLSNKSKLIKTISIFFSAHLLAGEDCGVAPLPNQTSSILVRRLLMKPALDITLSLAERLVMVDSGCGRETVKNVINIWQCF